MVTLSHCKPSLISPSTSSSPPPRRPERNNMTAQNGHAAAEPPVQNPASVVIYSPPGMAGHLVPAAELGKLLAAQGLKVTILLGGGGASLPLAKAFAADNPELSFHVLPPASLAPDVAAACSFEARLFELARAANPDLRAFLRASPPAALLLDFFCSPALDVGLELAFPTYFYLTTCVASVTFGLYHPVIDKLTTVSFGDMGSDPVQAPGLPPIPADHLSAATLVRDSLSNRHFVELGLRMCDSSGVLVNSCRALEARAADAIVSGLCTPPGRTTPPLYCVGPLVKRDEENTAASKRHECLAWLDAQPDASVVFLCFGSMGRFGAEQVMAMAEGLEASGQRFLWVVRRPPAPGAERRPPAPGDDDGDVDELFPEGFRERTKGRGLVVMTWAPQRQVLAHAAVGGFVSHCGWNSVLEAVMAGVPIVAWPLYAEQRMNRVFLVEEMRLAVAMEGYDKKMVEAGEVAAKVRWVIESDGGKELRERMRAAKRLAEEAMADGGESRTALVDLATQWKKCAAGDS